MTVTKVTEMPRGSEITSKKGIMMSAWMDFESTRTSTCKCRRCQRYIGVGMPVYYLVKGKSWIPFCCENCRTEEKREWTAKKAVKHDLQAPLF